MEEDKTRVKCEDCDWAGKLHQCIRKTEGSGNTATITRVCPSCSSYNILLN